MKARAAWKLARAFKNRETQAQRRVAALCCWAKTAYVTQLALSADGVSCSPDEAGHAWHRFEGERRECHAEQSPRALL